MKKESGNLKKNLYWNLGYTGILIFFLFRIPITNMIGNEGNGFLSVSLVLYGLFSLFFGDTSLFITSKLVRESVQKQQYRNAKKLFVYLLIISLFISVMGAALLYFVSDTILSVFHMKLSGIHLRVMSIFLIFHALAGVFRGYFEGLGSKMPTYFSGIIEAFIFGTSSLIFVSSLKTYGAKVGALLFNSSYEAAFGAAGAAAGSITGAVFSLIFLLLIHKMYQGSLQGLLKKDSSTSTVSFKAVLTDYFKSFSLFLLELVFFYLYRITNMYLYIKKNAQADSNVKYVEILGSFYGKIFVTSAIFVFLILSMTGKNIGRIKKNYKRNRFEYCLKYFYDDIRQIAVFTLPVCVILLIFGKNLLDTLFSASSVLEVKMFRTEVISIFFMVLGIYLSGLLSRLDKTWIKIICLFLSYIVQTIVMAVIINVENLSSLSFIIAELCFWVILAVSQFLVLWKNIFSAKKSM